MSNETGSPPVLVCSVADVVISRFSITEVVGIEGITTYKSLCIANAEGIAFGKMKGRDINLCPTCEVLSEINNDTVICLYNTLYVKGIYNLHGRCEIACKRATRDVCTLCISPRGIVISHESPIFQFLSCIIYFPVIFVGRTDSTISIYLPFLLISG